MTAYIVKGVVICFQISIFAPLGTAGIAGRGGPCVVICFQISIFAPLGTALNYFRNTGTLL